MSPQVTSGVRVLAQMSASTSVLISPRRRILSGGISRPFLEQIGGVAAVGAGDLAAEVWLVGDIADEADQPLGGEHRRNHGDVGRVVLARLVGMIDDEGIAQARWRRGSARRISFDLAAKGPICSGCGMPARPCAPAPSKIGEGEILAFLDDGSNSPCAAC
jgi:hypothetical protein